MLLSSDSLLLTLRQLRTRVAVLEGGCREAVDTIVPFDVPALDQVLPWGGLPGGLHEIRQDLNTDGVPHDGAALWFATYCLG